MFAISSTFQCIGPFSTSSVSSLAVSTLLSIGAKIHELMVDVDQKSMEHMSEWYITQKLPFHADHIVQAQFWFEFLADALGRGAHVHSQDNVSRLMDLSEKSGLARAIKNLPKDEGLEILHAYAEERQREFENAQTRVTPMSNIALATTGVKCAGPECDVVGVHGTNMKLGKRSACKCVYYCSQECEKRHWKVYKKVCRSKATKENKN
jgi:hypothetical protein